MNENMSSVFQSPSVAEPFGRFQEAVDRNSRDGDYYLYGLLQVFQDCDFDIKQPTVLQLFKESIGTYNLDKRQVDISEHAVRIPYHPDRATKEKQDHTYISHLWQGTRLIAARSRLIHSGTKNADESRAFIENFVLRNISPDYPVNTILSYTTYDALVIAACHTHMAKNMINSDIIASPRDGYLKEQFAKDASDFEKLMCDTAQSVYDLSHALADEIGMDKAGFQKPNVPLKELKN